MIRSLTLTVVVGLVSLAVFAGMYGGWLLATPDEDGGRAAVGRILAAAAGAALALACLLGFVSRRLR